MATSPPDARPNLVAPVPLTSFVGREREVAQVAGLLRRNDVRLLTLTGPGGVGKTRLALAAAAAIAADFADGVRFIPLAAVQDHRLVAGVLAQALGVRELGAQPFADQIRAAAAETESLLLVDNLEHLLPTAPLLIELLGACPRVKLLVTSRERLHLSGEHHLPVPPLAYPEPERRPSLQQVADAPAVRLFLARAQAVDPDFTLTDANADAIAAICHRLDGLPLALELAAARSPHLPPAALLARLASRLPLLTGGPRDVPARLQTMRAAITWSYDLLTPDEQALFRHLAVFTGGFTLGAAETVSRGVEEARRREVNDELLASGVPSGPARLLDSLGSLVDKSLVRRVAAPAPGRTTVDGEPEPRFEVLETIREFGLEQLQVSGEADRVHASHAAFYLALADVLASPGSDEAARLDQLETEHANLRAALAWSCSGSDPSVALRLATRLGYFWYRRGHLREGREWLERALAIAPDDDPTLNTAALNALGDLLPELGDYTAAKGTFAFALDLARACRDRVGEATALSGLAGLSDDIADNATTKRLSEASVAIWRELGDDRGLALALHHLAWAEAGLGNDARAIALFQEILGHFRASGDHRGVAHTLSSLGNMLVDRGEFAAARSYIEDGLAVAQAAHDWQEIAESQADLGWLTLELGDTASACAYLAACLAPLRETQRQRHLVYAIEACAVLADADGQRELAIRLVATTSAIRNDMALPLEDDARMAPTGPDSARHTLRALIAAAAAGGHAWSMNEAVREAEAYLAARPHPREDLAGEGAHRGLSPREREVLKLIVAGHSDQAIADALFISRKTASKHVGSILAKLGVASRAEAAVHAVRDGLG